VDVRVWHDGQCSGGATIAPYPTGDVLGSEDRRFFFYAVPPDAQRLNVTFPSPGFMNFRDRVTPITISGAVPQGLTDVSVDYTITMPGYILEHGQITAKNGTFQIKFNPVSLQQEFPNLDLVGRDNPGEAGLADTVAIGLLLEGQSATGPVYLANTITLQGNQVYVGE
jgi:hypothetical protein